MKRATSGSKATLQCAKKASQSSSPAGDEAIKIIFGGGAPQGGFSCPCGAIHLLYVDKNTDQAASLAPQRCAERNRRRRLLAVSLCESSANGNKGGPARRPALRGEEQS